jgi:hypothetical protein
VAWRTPLECQCTSKSTPFQSFKGYSSCSSVSEEHLMGLSMSVCLYVTVFTRGRQPAWPGVITAQQWELRSHCWNTMLHKNDLRSHYRKNDLRRLLEHIVAQQKPWITLVQQWPTWCGEKTTSGMSAYPSEYSFPILFNNTNQHYKLKCMDNYVQWIGREAAVLISRYYPGIHMYRLIKTTKEPHSRFKC